MSRPGIWTRLEKVPEFRAGNRFYPLPCLLAIGLCALSAAGHDGIDAIAQWVGRASEAELVRLRVPRDPFTRRPRCPSASTIRRALMGVDPDALVEAVLAPDAPRRDEADIETTPAARVCAARAPVMGAVALDGKSCRGARRGDGTRVHLVGAVTHGDGLLVGHVEVDRKSNETTAFQPLLAPMDLADTVVTFDALHSVRANLEWLVTAKKAHYLAVIKANQPRLFAQLKALPWADIPVADVTRDHGHGRDETRTVKVTTVDRLDFPHAAQVIRIHRWRRESGTAPSRQTVYAVTDLTFHQAGGVLLGDLARSHWHVENKAHYTRDVSFREDHSTVRTGNAPMNLATLRSAVINALRQVGYALVPPGRRDHTTPTAALDLHSFP
ncbi:conserved hypothetical protein [Frankia canadensis]|uniref:Transposase n=1 Tax=Frankia canadensis TaxID=1836972 RepID=A0A2I2KI79_9ACTN|nr:conserved hypothetical protein [Frankia canadensis]SOU52662.1 conserved hypothetical protein [Frankia canadensis]